MKTVSKKLVLFGILTYVINNPALIAQSIVSVQPQNAFTVATIGKAIYSVNANTGTMKQLTSLSFVSGTANAISLDSARGIIYYIENSGSATNTAIYGYNFRTNTHFTLINNFRTAPGAPTIVNGIGTGGATVYNGDLYIGVEYSRSLSPGVAPIVNGSGTFYPFSNQIYKISLNAAGTSITNTTVLKDYYNDNGHIGYISVAEVPSSFDSDWGDFVIIKDTLYERTHSFNSSGSFIRSNAYLLASPTNPLISTITSYSDKFLQTAEDGLSNLIFVGSLSDVNQQYVLASKTDGTYSAAAAKNMTLSGANFTNQIADATSVFKGEGVIGNTVWNDVNVNGFKEAGEAGISNAVVELWEDVDNNGVIDIVLDKLDGTAITDNTGHYSFINILPGNYLVRTIMTTSVNYPSQNYSAAYPFNQLAAPGVTLIDAGDETMIGSYSANLLTKNFSTVSFNDQTVDFGFTGTFTVLATNSLTLKTHYANGIVIANWEMVSSNTEKKYSVEKSIDGINFFAIEDGSITNSTFTKTTIDNNLPPNIFTLYYRIKITNNEGLVKYSNIEKVNIRNDKNEAVFIFPNPANESVTLLLPTNLINKKILINLTNAAGQIVKTFTSKLANSNLNINIAGFKAGTYFWNIFIENEKNIYSQGKLQVL